MSKKLTFRGKDISEVEVGGQKCITLSEVAQILYGKGTPQSDGPFGKPNGHAEKALQKTYQRHADEFSETMTAVVKLETVGGMQKVRVFSLRGCHLLGMLARTPVAKEFRKWALDVIDDRDRERDQNLPRLYRAIADYTAESKVASVHGKGLSRWKGIKPEKQATIDNLLGIIQPPLFK